MKNKDWYLNTSLKHQFNANHKYLCLTVSEKGKLYYETSEKRGYNTESFKLRLNKFRPNILICLY